MEIVNYGKNDSNRSGDGMGCGEREGKTVPGMMFYFSDRKFLKRLPAIQRAEIYEAMLDYAEFGTVASFTDPVQDLLWEVMRQKLDREIENYAKRVEKSRRAAEKRWHPERVQEPACTCRNCEESAEYGRDEATCEEEPYENMAPDEDAYASGRMRPDADACGRIKPYASDGNINSNTNTNININSNSNTSTNSNTKRNIINRYPVPEQKTDVNSVSGAEQDADTLRELKADFFPRRGKDRFNRSGQLIL